MDGWPPTPRPQSRLLPETYDVGMLLELEDVDARFDLFLMSVMLVLKATSNGVFDERWRELCGHIVKVEILERILSERKLDSLLTATQKGGIREKMVNEREKRVDEEEDEEDDALYPIEVGLGCKVAVLRMMSEGTLKEVGFWDERIYAPPKGGTAMLTAVHIKDDAAGQEAMRDAMSRRSASSAKKERSKSKVGSTARNSGHSPEIRTEDEKPKTSYSDVGDKDRGRKRQRTNKIVQNASAKSVKSKAGSTASNSDNTPEILPMHETPNISFDDTGNDDSVDEVDELVVDGTSRGEDRSASSGDDDSIQLEATPLSQR